MCRLKIKAEISLEFRNQAKDHAMVGSISYIIPNGQ